MAVYGNYSMLGRATIIFGVFGFPANSIPYHDNENYWQHDKPEYPEKRYFEYCP